MKQMGRLFLVFLVLCCWGSQMEAQREEQDFQSWYGVALKGEAFKVLDYSVEPEVRLSDNSRMVDSWQTEFDVSYKLNKWFKLGGAYRFQNEVSNPEFNQFNHRVSVYAKFDAKWELLKFYYKARYQTQYATVVNSDKDKLPSSDHRHKIGVNLGKKKWFANPFVSAEYYFRIRPTDEAGRGKRRLALGAEKRMTKHLDVNVSYMYQSEFNKAKPEAKHILTFGLAYELH